MPPPIVPAPITAARRISRTGVSAAMPGIFETARSAKNAWISALHCVDSRHSRNSSRLPRAALFERKPRARSPPLRSPPAEPSGRASSSVPARAPPRKSQDRRSRSLRSRWLRARRRAGPRFRAQTRSRPQQVALDDAVHDPRGQRVSRADRFAEGAHLHRLRESRQPRQPLRARCARE